MRRFRALWVVCMLAGLLCLGGQPAQAEQVAAIKIMPLGDSITCSVEGQASYRYYLWHLLGAAGYQINFVGSLVGVYNNNPPLYPNFDQDHEGHSGYKTLDIVPKITGWAQAAQPDVVLIHLGTVDMAANGSVQDAMTALGLIIDKLRAVNSNVKIFLAQIIPATDTALRNRIQIFNQQIPVLAASKNTAISPVRVVNQYAGFDPESDTWDGLHPDASGEQKLATRWYAAFQIFMHGTPVAYLPLVMR